MAKAKGKNADLLAMALEATKVNTTKGRGGSGRTTYLDRFVQCLTDEKGNPIEPKTRNQITAEISLDIALEQRAEQQAEDSSIPDFMLTEAGDTEDDLEFKKINKRVKNQVAAAIANNQNSTSVSYNEKYKDKYRVEKHEGGLVSLVLLDS